MFSEGGVAIPFIVQVDDEYDELTALTVSASTMSLGGFCSTTQDEDGYANCEVTLPVGEYSGV